MNAELLRQVWRLVSQFSDPMLLNLRDHELVAQLLQEFSLRQTLSHDDYHRLKAYLDTRTPLIREMLMAS